MGTRGYGDDCCFFGGIIGGVSGCRRVING